MKFPEHVDVFGSHLPVLKALDPKPRTVLEFGAGHNSTQAFLAMPSVKRLVSVETYPEWRAQLRQKFGYSKRWTLLGDYEHVPPLLDFDLVFIDDGTTEDERIHTIVAVLDQAHPKVVIHDAEFHRFLAAIETHARTDYVIYKDQVPHTAVVEAWPA